MGKLRISKVFTYFILSLYAFICAYPFIWMMATSLKTQQEALLNPIRLLPEAEFQFQNYAEVWSELSFLRYFFNSFTISITVVIGVVIIYSLLGFAIAKIDFAGRSFIKWLFLSLMLVPGVTIVVPLFANFKMLGLDDTFAGVVLPMINGGGPFAVLLFTNYFKTIPNDIYESSVMDGLNKFGIYLRIYMPLGIPAMATIAIMNFLGSWNALLWPMVVLTNNESLYTLPLGLMELLKHPIPRYNIIMTGGVISILPVLVMFLFLQKYYIEGLTAGAVKA